MKRFFSKGAYHDNGFEKACGAKQRGALEAESFFKEGTLLTTLLAMTVLIKF